MQVPSHTRKKARWRKFLFAGFSLSLLLLVYTFALHWIMSRSIPRWASAATYKKILSRFSKGADPQEAPPHKNGLPDAAIAPAPSHQASPGGPAHISNVHYWITDEYRRVVFDLNAAVRFEKRRSDKEGLQFDLLAAQLGPHLDGKALSVDDSLLKEIRLTQQTPDSVRVALGLGPKAEYTILSLQNPYRIVVDVSRPGEKPARPAERPLDRLAGLQALTSNTGGAKGQPRALDKPAPAENTAKAENIAKTVAKEARPLSITGRALPEVAPGPPGPPGPPGLIRTLRLKIRKIVIDPGHGGWDAGAVGKAGLKEKEVALDVARRLGKMLDERLGASVFFTRADDRFIPLEERTAMANAYGADLFISIHANASKNTGARGIETFFLSLTPTDDVREVVARENATAQKSIHELEDLVKKITLNEKITESREFASTVQQNLFKGLSTYLPKTQNRGVKRAPFIVLIGAKMPSILAEISFLSNPADEKFLRQESSREKIAEALYRGVEAYIRTLGGGNLALTEKGQ
jgi:N-acetylmuramoyl-L-alanine amidase